MEKVRNEDGRTFTYVTNGEGKKEVVEISVEVGRFELFVQAVKYLLFNAKPDVLSKKDVDWAFFRERSLDMTIHAYKQVAKVLEQKLDPEEGNNRIYIRDARNLVLSLETLQNKIKR